MTQMITLEPAYLDVKFRSGNDLSFDITFPFVLTGFTITAPVDALSFTISPSVLTGVTKITLSLTTTQTAQVKNNSAWSLTLAKTGELTRTYISGKMIRI